MLLYCISFSFLILTVLLIRAVFRKRIRPRYLYWIWLVVVLRLCIPFSLFDLDLPIPSFSMTSVEMDPFPSPTTVPDHVPAVPDDTSPVPEHTVPVSDRVPPETNPTSVTNRVPQNTSAVITEDTAPPVVQTENKITVKLSTVLLAVWIAGSVVMLCRFTVSGSILQARLRKDRRLIGKAGRIRIYVTQTMAAPCLAGLLPSVYLTPQTAEDPLILRHELTHVRHGDPVWNIVRVAALTAFWWNPLIWAAAILSGRDAELACDDAVTADMNSADRLAYARAILNAVPQKAPVVIAFGGSPLKERMQMLAHRNPGRRICLALAFFLTVFAVGFSFIGARMPEDNDLPDKAEITAEADQTAKAPADPTPQTTVPEDTPSDDPSAPVTERTSADTTAETDPEQTAKREEELTDFIRTIPGVKDYRDGVIYTNYESFNQYFTIFNWLEMYCARITDYNEAEWKPLVAELAPYCKAISFDGCYLELEDYHEGLQFPKALTFRGQRLETAFRDGLDGAWKLTLFGDVAIFEQNCDSWIISEKGVFAELREQYANNSSQRYRRTFSVQNGKLICTRTPDKYCCVSDITQPIDTCGGIGELRCEKSVVTFAQDGSPIYTVIGAERVTREYLQGIYYDALHSMPDLPSLDEMLEKAAQTYELVI